MRKCILCAKRFSEKKHRCPDCGAVKCPQCDAVICIACGHMYPHDEVHCSRCGALPEGMILDRRYELESMVGKGGKGRIYRAKMIRLGGKLCGLKEMLPPQLSSGDPGTSTRARYERARKQFERAKELFEREAVVLARLNHPNIPRVYDYFEERDRSYLVMDFVEGTSLQKVIDYSEDYLSQAQVLEWVLQVCDVLDYLHSQEPQPLVHRDVKPANLILADRDGEERVMLVDFGIARTYTGEKEHDTHYIATRNFAAPEQLGRIRLESSPQTDIYALGATLYYLLVNKGDEDETFLEVNEKGIIGLPHIYVSPALEEVIRKACAWHPKDRFGSVREMRKALEEIGGESVVEVEEGTYELQCYFHPSRAADDICDVCGKAICEECTISRQGKCLCPDCVTEQETTTAKEEQPIALPIEDAIVPIEVPWEEEEPPLDTLRRPAVLIPLAVIAAVIICAMLVLAARAAYPWIQEVSGNPSPIPAFIASPTDTPLEPVIVVVSTSTPVPTSPVGTVQPTRTPTKTPTRRPRHTSTPTATRLVVAPIPTPKSEVDFKIVKQSMRPLGSAKCEIPEIHMYVLDKDGNPLDNILLEIYWEGGSKAFNSGWLGPGYEKATVSPGTFWVRVVGDVRPFGDRNYTSEVSRPLSTDHPSRADLEEAGYCQPGGECVECGLYSYEVVFQRQW